MYGYKSNKTGQKCYYIWALEVEGEGHIVQTSASFECFENRNICCLEVQTIEIVWEDIMKCNQCCPIHTHCGHWQQNVWTTQNTVEWVSFTLLYMQSMLQPLGAESGGKRNTQY